MDAVFVRDSRSLFRSEPLAKTFYCPTPPRPLSKHDQKTTLTPSHSTHTPHKLHWDVVCVTSSSNTGVNSILSTSGSSQFNESWPSDSDVGGVRTTSPVAVDPEPIAQAKVEEEKGKEVTAKPATLARYIERFRSAPPTSRNTRDAPSQPFWWKQTHVTSFGDHVTTSPRSPQDHSTPDCLKTRSYTVPFPRGSASSSPGQPRVSPGLDSSLEGRSQELIDRSSSLLSAGSSSSSMPARKYLNTAYTQTGEIKRKAGPSVTGNTLQETARLCQDGLFDDPTRDILNQWRLKRRLEVARREADRLVTDPFQPPANSDMTVTHHTHRLCPACCGCGRSRLLLDTPPCPDHSKLNKCVCRPGVCCQGGRADSCDTSVRPAVCPRHSRLGLVGPTVGDMDMPQGNITNDSCLRSQPNKISNTTPSLNSRNTHTEHTAVAAIGGHSGAGSLPPSAGQDLPVPASGPAGSLSTEDGSDDINLSSFSLDFTTELNHTSSKPAIPLAASVEPVVSEVVRTHLFGKSASIPATPHTAVPPSQSTPHTVTTPSQSTPHTVDTPQSQDQPTSKRGATYSLSRKTRKATQLPWDCHMEDYLLKLLITKAKLFEGQINNINRVLSACDEYPL